MRPHYRNAPLGGQCRALRGIIDPRLQRQLDGARVIAADSGMAHAATLKLVPEIWVGDFDSSPKQLLDHWHNVPRQQHPKEKDASDGELAISEALRRGATSLILVGGMGGQLDHVLAHAGFLVGEHSHTHHTRPLVDLRLKRQRIADLQAGYVQDVLAVVGH